jgi:hypothetical protein
MEREKRACENSCLITALRSWAESAAGNATHSGSQALPRSRRGWGGGSGRVCTALPDVCHPWLRLSLQNPHEAGDGAQYLCHEIQIYILRLPALCWVTLAGRCSFLDFSLPGWTTRNLPPLRISKFLSLSGTSPLQAQSQFWDPIVSCDRNLASGSIWAFNKVPVPAHQLDPTEQ